MPKTLPNNKPTKNKHKDEVSAAHVGMFFHPTTKPMQAHFTRPPTEEIIAQKQ